MCTKMRRCSKSAGTSLYRNTPTSNANVFVSMNVKPLSALEAPARRITVKKSMIPHPDAGLGFFASGTIRKDGVVGY